MVILQSPLKFTPADNPVVFKFGTTTTEMRLFTLDLIDVKSDVTFYTGKVYPSPNLPDYGFVNLQNQLKSVVRPEPDNKTNFIEPKTDPIIKYKLFVQDFGVSGTTGLLYPISTGITSEDFYAYESRLNNVFYSNSLSANTFLMTTATTSSTKFLTFKPNNIKVNQYSNEQLYMIYTGRTSPRMFIEYENNLGEFTNQQTIPLTGGTGLFGIGAQTIFNGFVAPFLGSSNVTVTIDHPISGLTQIYNANVGVPLSSPTDAQWTEQIATALTGMSLGFSAGYISGTSLVIYGSDALGSNMNYKSIRIVTNAFDKTQFFTGGTGGIDLYNMYRLQVSPKALIASGLTIETGYAYTIKILNSQGTTISETRRYIYEDVECNLDYVNILFTNSAGGIDTIQCVNPRLNYKNNPSYLQTSPLNIFETKPYITDNIYNSEKKIYNNLLSSSVSVYTKPLDDIESEWLIELINSQNIWIELKGGDLLPVTLQNTDYQLKKKKYTTGELIQYEFTFELPSNFYNIYDNQISIIIND